MEEEQLAAYDLMLKTITLLGKDKELVTDNRDFIIKAITLALEHPKIVQFEHLNNIPAVKAIKEAKTEEKLCELLNIFTHETIEEYNTWESENKKYLDIIKIDSKVLRNKIMYLSFCSLAMKDNVISYDKLAEIVGIQREEIEEWLIDAIVNEIIDARIDQEREEVMINTFTQRSANLKERLDKTSVDFETVLENIQP